MNVSVPVRPSDVSLAIKVIIASFVCEIFDVALNFTTYFPADPDLSQTEDFIATML
ncbi:MAG TPA: hypothetical protein PK765_00520 [bacterium]|nr:hypothetical protein [bacterium]